MKKTKKRIPVNFDYAKWQNKLELDRLKKSIDEFTYYPCSKEINKQVDYIIERDVKRKYFDNYKIEIQYRYRVLNDFYSLLFDITNFDELKFIDVGNAINDPKYRKNSGKIVSKNFFQLNPHLDNSTKLKSIVSSFINKEFFLIDGLTQLQKEKKRIERIRVKTELNENSPVLKVYNEVIQELIDSDSISVRKACNNVYDKTGDIKFSDFDLEAFYKRFLSFFETDKNRKKYPEAYQIIQHHKQKKVSSR